MPTPNPYQAPSADVTSSLSDATYEPKVFTYEGRIGRLRYLAYSFASMLVMIPLMLVAGILSGMLGDSGESGVFMVLGGAAYLFYFVFLLIFAKRRFNDLNQTGWLCLLILIPLINLIVGLILIFKAGTPTNNKFGARPTLNTTWVKLGAFGMPAVFILGILAAIALPAYSDYVTRAQQAESLYSE